MVTELERQVAETRCVDCGGNGDLSDINGPRCCTCHGTGLRWPMLSQETLNDSCSNCAFPRVPDVTLEKVLDIHIVEGRTQPQDWFLFDRLLLRTPREAACAALLASTA